MRKKVVKEKSKRNEATETKRAKSQDDKPEQTCTSHFFQMRPLPTATSPYFQNEVKMFYPHKDKSVKPFPKVLTSLDQMPYATLFGLEAEEERYKRNEKAYKEAFEKELMKHSQYVDERSPRSQRISENSIYEPIPKNTYCQICRRHFDDYKKHMRDLEHGNNIKISYGNQYIGAQIEEEDQKMKNLLNDKDYLELFECLNILKKGIVNVKQTIHQMRKK